MIEPQLLPVPLTSYNLEFNLSLSGLTHLKKGKYKERHNLPKQITQVPKGKFILKKNLPSASSSASPLRIKRQPELLQKSSKVKIEKNYKIKSNEISHRIKGFVNQMKGEKQLYFWTVSFPVGTIDDECFRLLNIWLTRLRTEKMLKQYLWITERQKNGTLHYHLCINNRMCVKKANKFMRASIMHSINKGLINWSRDAAKKYNGVDIAKNKKTKRTTNFAKQKNQKNLTSYITKYVTKNKETFKHLAWHCSREYSALITSCRFTIEELRNSNTKLFLTRKKLFKNEWFDFFKWKDEAPIQVGNYLKICNNVLFDLLGLDGS